MFVWLMFLRVGRAVADPQQLLQCKSETGPDGLRRGFPLQCFRPHVCRFLSLKLGSGDGNWLSSFDNGRPLLVPDSQRIPASAIHQHFPCYVTNTLRDGTTFQRTGSVTLLKCLFGVVTPPRTITTMRLHGICRADALRYPNEPSEDSFNQALN